MIILSVSIHYAQSQCPTTHSSTHPPFQPYTEPTILGKHTILCSLYYLQFHSFVGTTSYVISSIHPTPYLTPEKSIQLIATILPARHRNFQGGNQHRADILNRVALIPRSEDSKLNQVQETYHSRSNQDPSFVLAYLD